MVTNAAVTVAVDDVAMNTEEIGMGSGETLMDPNYTYDDSGACSL